MTKGWLESQYPMLADVIKTTNTSTSFHLAEENKKDFPHEDVRDYIHAGHLFCNFGSLVYKVHVKRVRACTACI